MSFWEAYGEAARTATGFFWKSGWAFVLGYFVSGMIQSFVPKGRLTQYMGGPGAKSVALATFFGAASSSCSFAALATARSLVLKGAHFVAAVAFMFASTNLVIELGILIVIFLGWEFLAAEVIGGLCLITLSTVLIRLTYPRRWARDARERVEEETSASDDDFDWRERIRSRRGWHLVGHKFVMDWKMVWEEILIGFTVAGFVAVLVPARWWAAVFMQEGAASATGFTVILENALVAPLVAAMTFIGSMGNIPLATVLSSNGVLFAGIMGFIYSDLMVPPLVSVNAKYYGWRLALYIAAVMYVSIVATALLLHYAFAALGALPESTRAISETAQFAVDYTFWFNLVFAAIAAWLVFLHRRHVYEHGAPTEREGNGLGLKRLAAFAAVVLLVVGWIAHAVTHL